MITEAQVAAETPGQGTPTLHTADEAAAILRVKRSWLERQAAARKIPFTVLGGSYRFTSAHLAEIVRLYEQLPGPRAEGAGRKARPPREATTTFAAPGQSAPLRPRPRNGPPKVA